MKATLTIDAEFNPEVTDAESLGHTLDSILTEALEDPSLVEDLGNPQFHGFEVQESPADASHWPPVGVMADAIHLFDQITGASYHGVGFKKILIEDEEAFKAARTLVDLLKHHGMKGME